MPRWLDDLVGYNQILADDGTPARRRHILKFVGATVVDDGEATVVTTSGATTQAEYFLGAPEPSLPNHRLPVESSTIGWNLATPNTFVAFVKPGSVVTALEFREEGALVGVRAALNALDTPSITLSFVDDAVNGEVELTAIRAALTGAVTAVAGSNVTAFGAAASLSVLVNPTNGSAVPDYLQAAGAREHLRVNAAGTALEWGVLQLADFPVIPSDTFLANVGISPAAPTAVTLVSVAGPGLVWDSTLNEFQVGGSTSIIVGANDVQRAALTGFAVAGQNVNATTSAEPIVSYSASANMTNERVLTTGTNNTVDISVASQIRVNWDGMQFRRNSGTLLTARRRANLIEGTSISITINSDAGDDENEVTIAYNGVIPGAVSGAVTHAAGGGNSVFSGIRINGGTTTDRTNLNFENTVDGQWTLVDDGVNDEIEINFTPLGSFYSENSVGSFQTRFISFDDSTMLDGEVVDNTGGSGFINVSFELKPQSAARTIGRARGAGVGIPTALTPDQTAAILRWDSQTDVNVAGLATDVAVGEGVTSLRFSNGGATGIVRSIAAPTEEGQLIFPEMTTGGGDEWVYVHEDTSQTAANRIKCPGNRPFYGNSGGPPHALFYWPRSNRWAVIGPVGGHQIAITEIDEHFDSGIAQSVESSTPILLPFRNNEFSWALCGNPLGTGSGGVNSISNVLSHRGIWRIDTGTATNDATCIFLGRDVITGTLATNEALYDSDNIHRFACWVRIPTDTSVHVNVGFMQDPVNIAGGTEFIGFDADTSGGTSTTNWVLMCRAASVNTNVDSGVAWTGALWHKLEFFRYDEYVIFYINRVFAGLISTNVPNGGGTIAFRVQTRTNLERTLDVDRVIVEVLESSLD